MIIRPEEANDIAAVRSIVAAAFTRPEQPDQEPVEAPLLDRLRVHPSWLPKLSLVAVDADGEVIGHVLCTRGTVTGADTVDVLALGPIGVRPDRQAAGVGTALMHAVLGAADALGEPLVGLVGSPEFYGRFGFRPSTEFGIEPPNPQWGHYFQVRPLSAYRRRPGVFAFPAPFDEM